MVELRRARNDLNRLAWIRQPRNRRARDRRKRRSPEFAAWLAIQLRGRVCARWKSFSVFYFDNGPRPSWRHLFCRRYQPPVRAGQCPMAGWANVSAATTDRADTLMPLIASAFASYSAAHPRYRFGHDD
jgi:hypothetical protein